MTMDVFKITDIGDAKTGYYFKLNRLCKEYGLSYGSIRNKWSKRTGDYVIVNDKYKLEQITVV